jgi:transcriptional regulator with XRE-family HTH domain
MPELIGPAIARERLGARLRELRESCGLSVADVERAMHWPASTLNDFESGTEAIPPLQVEAVLATYGVADDREVSQLMLLAQVARTTGWWGRHGLTDEHQRYVAHEAEARRITVYQPLLVPGLLQIVPYARAATAAILNKPPEHPDVVARVQLRNERQRVVEDRVSAGRTLELVAFIEEAVLRRPIGGPAVLRDQLDHLLTQGRRPHVTLVVMPTRLRGHAGLGGVFEFIEIDDRPDSAMVFIESGANDFITRDAHVVAIYRRNIEQLRDRGLTGDSAFALIQETRDALV